MAQYKYGSALDVETAFTTVAILTMVTHPANMLMTIAPLAVASLASFERVEQYLLEAFQRDCRRYDPKVSNSAERPGITLQNVSIGFHPSSGNVLENIGFDVPPGSFVACLGPVGSGKTSLLRAIAGDLECSSGSILTPRQEGMALCTQIPWLPAGTIRHVICVDSQRIDEEWYQTVIHACCLDVDFRALAFQDSTQLGSRGSNLSGGQRQRVVRSCLTSRIAGAKTNMQQAIARALYSRCHILLLDDPFSALDTETSSRIAQNLFGGAGLCRQSNMTVFLTTNSSELSFI